MALAGAGFHFLTRDGAAPPEAEQPDAIAPPAAHAAPAAPPAPAATSTAASTASAAGGTPAVASAADDLTALQSRLEALAKAYNERDVPGLERAMWKNHAVVRPTGETMYRADLIGQWTREWSDFRKHQLSFVVDQVRRDGEQLTAVWDLVLVADVTDAQGAVHVMEINASQRAVYTVSGGDWVLDGPIAYVGFERTLDGDPWPMGENGR